MTNRQKQMEAMKFDKRLIELNMKTHLINETEYHQHLKSLEDRQVNADVLKLTRQEPAVVMAPRSPDRPVARTNTTPLNAEPFGSGF